MDEMTDKQKEVFPQILSHFIKSSNMLMEPSIKLEWLKEIKIGSNLFKEYFPERPEDELDDIIRCCRSLYAHWTHTDISFTYQTRTHWGHLLYGENYKEENI